MPFQIHRGIFVIERLWFSAPQSAKRRQLAFACCSETLSRRTAGHWGLVWEHSGGAVALCLNGPPLSVSERRREKWRAQSNKYYSSKGNNWMEGKNERKLELQEVLLIQIAVAAFSYFQVTRKQGTKSLKLQSFWRRQTQTSTLGFWNPVLFLRSHGLQICWGASNIQQAETARCFS